MPHFFKVSDYFNFNEPKKTTWLTDVLYAFSSVSVSCETYIGNGDVEIFACNVRPGIINDNSGNVMGIPIRKFEYFTKYTVPNTHINYVLSLKRHEIYDTSQPDTKKKFIEFLMYLNERERERDNNFYLHCSCSQNKESILLNGIMENSNGAVNITRILDNNSGGKTKNLKKKNNKKSKKKTQKKKQKI